MTMREVLNGKPYARDPHVWFSERKFAMAARSRRETLLNNAVLIGAVCAMALNCLAVDKYYLITNETSKNNGAFYNPTGWSSTGNSSGTALEDFDSTAEYLVYKDNGGKLYVKGASSASFEGGTLVLGQGSGNSWGQMYHYVSGANVITFGNNGLRIQHGCLVFANSHRLTHITDGPINVDTAEGAYASIEFCYNSLVFRHKGSLSVAEGDVLFVGSNESGVGKGLNNTIELPAENSCAGVKGSIEVLSHSNLLENAVLGNYDTTFAVAATELPGTLSVGTNCHLKLLSGGDVLKVGTLSLAYNTWVTIPYGDSGMGRIDVTNAFTVGKKKIHVAVPRFEDGMERKIPIITAPAGTSMSSSDFVSDKNAPATWFSVEDIDGKVALCVNYPDVVQLSDVAELGASEAWSDELPVHEGADYCLDVAYVTNSGADSVSLKIPGELDPYMFAGDSLTIGAKGRLYGGKTVDSTSSLGTEFSCGLLRMMAGSRISLGTKVPITVSGGVLHAVNGIVTFAATNGRRFVVDSTIEGAADLLLAGHYDGTSSTPFAQYEFNAENNAFMGRIIIRQSKIDDYEYKDDNGNVVIGHRNSYESNYNSLMVTNALSLGGNLPSPEPKALLLSRYAKLIVKGDTTLSAQSNRGIFIEDIGRISVEASKTAPYTFRMETPLAINGDFYKDGVGTLELAGGMAFGEDGLGANPTDGKNNFIVTGGVVRVCSAGAVDGCKMLLHKDTALELAVDLDDDELLGCGIRNVKTDTPFVLGAGVDKLPVSMVFDADATPPSTDFTVALLTVSGDAAADVKAMLPTTVKSPFKSYTSTLVETTDEETGDVTFGYSLKYQGMKVIIR